MAKCYVFSIFQDKITHDFYKTVNLFGGITESYIKVIFCPKIHFSQLNKILSYMLIYFNRWILNTK